MQAAQACRRRRGRPSGSGHGRPGRQRRALKRANTLSEQRRIQAERNYTLAREAVDRYLTKVSEDRLLNQPHMVKLRQELLETAREFYQKLVDERKNDPQAQHDLGHAHLRLSSIAALLGTLRDATTEGEAAQSIFATLAEALPETREYQNDLAASYYHLAYVYAPTGRIEEAKGRFRHALELGERLLDASPKSEPLVHDLRHEVADTLYGLGCLYRDTGGNAEAEAIISRALGIQQQLVAENPGDKKSMRDLASSHRALGRCYEKTGRPLEAEAAFRRAATICQRLVNEYPQDVECREALANNQIDQGVLYHITGRIAEAVAAYRLGLKTFELLVVEHPEATEYQRHLASIHNNLGNCYEDTGGIAEAEDEFRQALAINEKLASAPVAGCPFGHSRRCQLLQPRQPADQPGQTTGVPGVAHPGHHDFSMRSYDVSPDTPPPREFLRKFLHREGRCPEPPGPSFRCPGRLRPGQGE